MSDKPTLSLIEVILVTVPVLCTAIILNAVEVLTVGDRTDIIIPITTGLIAAILRPYAVEILYAMEINLCG